MVAYNILAMLCSLIWPYMFCHFATLTTDRLLAISYEVYDWNWYELPAEMQKYTILVTARSQIPSYFNGFSLIRCTLEIFGKVIILIKINL